MLEVEVTNTGNTQFRGVFTVTAKEKAALTSTVNSLNGNLDPKYWVKGRLEMRECMPKGAKGFNDLDRCKACNPKLYFSGAIYRK